jgi:elongation factor P
MLSGDLKKGVVITIGDAACVVEKVTVQTPSSRGSNTLYKIRARNVKTRQKVDATFKGGENIPEPNFEKRSVQHLYKDTSHCHFMDTETYEQFTISRDDLDDELPYLFDGMEGIRALVIDEEVVGVELPLTIELEITECDPSVRGNSATSRSKKATLETGLVIQVPEHLSTGDRVRLDTSTGKFVARVSK